MNHRNFNTVLKAKQDDEVLFLLQIDKLKGLWRKFYRNCKKLGEVKFRLWASKMMSADFQSLHMNNF